MTKKPFTYSEEELINLRNAFDLYDQNRDGQISIDELSTVFAKLQIEISDSELKELLASGDVDGDDQLDFEEFVEIFMRSEAQLCTDDVIQETFRIMDRDKDGLLSFNDIQESFDLMKISIPYNLNEMISIADQDQDGFLNLDEFKALFSA